MAYHLCDKDHYVSGKEGGACPVGKCQGTLGPRIPRDAEDPRGVDPFFYGKTTQADERTQRHECEGCGATDQRIGAYGTKEPATLHRLAIVLLCGECAGPYSVEGEGRWEVPAKDKGFSHLCGDTFGTMAGLREHFATCSSLPRDERNRLRQAVARG